MPCSNDKVGYIHQAKSIKTKQSKGVCISLGRNQVGTKSILNNPLLPRFKRVNKQDPTK